MSHFSPEIAQVTAQNLVTPRNLIDAVYASRWRAGGGVASFSAKIAQVTAQNLVTPRNSIEAVYASRWRAGGGSCLIFLLRLHN